MSILIKPIITEKATKDAEDKNRYTFSVDKKANKIQIKKAVEAAYGVTVEKVYTLNYAPKRSVRYTKNVHLALWLIFQRHLSFLFQIFLFRKSA